MTAPVTATRPTATEHDQRLQALRGISRQLPTGVAVITGAYGDAVHGATVSTASVLSQQPLRLGISLRHGSYLTKLVQQRAIFVVNVLSCRQAAVADWFADPERPRGLRQFDYVPWTAHEQTGIPVLDGTLAHITCRLTNVIPLGTSDDLLVAEVLEGHGRNGRPLINFNGQLHDVEFRSVIRPGRRQASAVTLLE
ncbi:flavin reductase family protein [Streptomyces sp. Rer75]|uniref:flavin reductase family protein n=1 Tax=Streptomyces sp. Rer75 TaxID=2750011 RepID=UPI0015D0BE95|nr:flavin reductase family protein [Streptomyces sp. Rer75]QLH19362.1 flavin reductase [Streptomyces sp. Rer75]